METIIDLKSKTIDGLNKVTFDIAKSIDNNTKNYEIFYVKTYPTLKSSIEIQFGDDAHSMVGRIDVYDINDIKLKLSDNLINKIGLEEKFKFNKFTSIADCTKFINKLFSKIIS